ncbi:MAG: DUF721 domain-containing protein, partial [Streptomyces sp.]
MSAEEPAKDTPQGAPDAPKETPKTPEPSGVDLARVALRAAKEQA